MIVIILKNIQTIIEHQFQFDEKGVVQFYGQNSNGKSILAKVMSKVVYQQLSYNDKRLPLIRDGEESGVFAIGWNNHQLIVNIHREANKTFYRLVRPGGETVTRYVREDGIKELLHEFGFRVYGKNEVCTQICETYGRMPFVNTPDTINAEIVNSVVTDPASENFINSYLITYKEGAEQFKTAKAQQAKIREALEKIELKNISGMQAIITRLEICCKRAKYLKRVEPATLDLLPVLNFELSKCEMIPDIVLPVHYQKAEAIPDITAMLREIKQVRAGTCPTCGKLFIGGVSNCQNC